MKMSNTLNTVQKFFKAGKILSTIGFVASIVGAAGCIIGAAVLKMSGIGSKAADMVMNTEGMTYETAFASCIAGIIICAGSIAVSWLSRKYYDNELDAGTPFTFEGAKEIKRLGIVAIAVPLGAQIVSSIVFEIMSAVLDASGTNQMETEVSLTLGIIYIALSFVFRDGAELREGISDEANVDK